MDKRSLIFKEHYVPHDVEEAIFRYWDNIGLRKLIEDSIKSAKKKFYFLDGPPYVSAPSIHIGTAWNKVIKDSVLRYKRMQGYNVWDKPGFDCHGLPIEVQMEKQLGIKNKREIIEKIGIKEFVEKCKELALSNMEGMKEKFKDLGVEMDWNNPYLTLDPEYIESGWWLIKRAYEKGLLEEDVSVLHWCPRCETTLADYEVSEYRIMRDPSIYVLFPLIGENEKYIVIWTTTPWTLPANTMVMVHPDLDYAEVEAVVNDKRIVLVLLENRVKEVLEKEAGITHYSIKKKFKGKELVGKKYAHPLRDLVDAQKKLDEYHKIVAAPEAVSPYEGTGLVHAAPGHGTIDFEIAKKLGFPIVSLIDDQGRFVAEAGKYRGLYFKDANNVIIRDLKEKNALLASSTIEHRYPVCWRCKTPLILRATKQWFIRVSRLYKKLIEEADKVKWIPDWAKERFMNWIRDVRDWVISRQRYWGIPLPIWRCNNCGQTIVIGSKEELRKFGASYIPEDPHRPDIDEVVLKCPRCGGEMYRIPDVLDVWFDSGVSFYASLGYPKSKLWDDLKPVDFIVEGHDQTRGWFFSLLRSGVIGFGEAPYTTVLVHGFMLDEHGREMHKSLGNYVEPDEVIDRYGRDIFRLWVLGNTTWEDIRFSWKRIELAKKTLSIAWNVFRFAYTYMKLDKFSPSKSSVEQLLESNALGPEDKWLLNKTNKLVKEVTKAFEEYRIHEAVRHLVDFIVDDVSHWYIRLVRRKAWEEELSPQKLASYTVLYNALRTWLLLISPITPFISEYLYQVFIREFEDKAKTSIHLENWPSYREEYIDDNLEEKMSIVREVIENTLVARMKAGIKLRQPVARLIISSTNQKVLDAVNFFKKILLEQANAKNLEILSVEDFKAMRKIRVEPVLSIIGKEFKSNTPFVIKTIEEKNKEIAGSIATKGYYEITLENGKKLVLRKEHVRLVSDYPDWLSVKETDWGFIAIDTRLSKQEILEGLARDLVRRIQFMRKKLQLPVDTYIVTSIYTKDADMLEAVKLYNDYLKEETRSIEIRTGAVASEQVGEDELRESWDIDGREVVIIIKPVK